MLRYENVLYVSLLLYEKNVENLPLSIFYLIALRFRNVKIHTRTNDQKFSLTLTIVDNNISIDAVKERIKK